MLSLSDALASEWMGDIIRISVIWLYGIKWIISHHDFIIIMKWGILKGITYILTILDVGTTKRQYIIHMIVYN